MKNSLGKNNATKAGLSLLSMFVFVLALTTGMAYADTPTRSTDEITIFSSQLITAGSTLSTLVGFNFENISASQGGTVFLKPQSGVNSLSVLVNGTTCNTADVGSITEVPYNCNSSVLTAGILGATANISVTNNGITSHRLSATVSARYKETTPIVTVNTSGLATSAEVQSVNNTVLSLGANESEHFVIINGTTNATFQVANASNFTAFQINQTINSQTWMDSIASRVFLALDGLVHVLIRQSQILFE